MTVDLSGLQLVNYAPGTLLGICVLLVLTGHLVPSRTVKQALQDKDARIKHLESALDKSEAARSEERETSKVVRHFFDGLSGGEGR